MISDLSPTIQALLATLFTWGLTAAGSATVIFIRGHQRRLLDAALGFAAGVMIAASFWSLLAPAIDQAESSQLYGDEGQFASLPIALGFVLGGAFVYGTDKTISCLGIQSSAAGLISLNGDKRDNSHNPDNDAQKRCSVDIVAVDADDLNEIDNQSVRGSTVTLETDEKSEKSRAQWKRILLLVIAITVHNIPEGLAVGVSFGAIGTTPALTFEAARNLAIGIGIQNFPEGLAVSVPLHAAGFSLSRAFWYGQLSGIVEPIFGVLGALLVSTATIALPYALAFAAGAMIFVVADDILPEAHSNGNGQLATWGAIAGFTVMMILDVSLG